MYKTFKEACDEAGWVKSKDVVCPVIGNKEEVDAWWKVHAQKKIIARANWFDSLRSNFDCSDEVFERCYCEAFDIVGGSQPDKIAEKMNQLYKSKK